MSIHPTLNEYYRQKFGCKVYKLALDAGFTCPNRDGTLDTRGCVFCSAYGGGEFAQPACGSIAAQLELAKLTHLTAPTVSVTLQKMEQNGLITRTPDPQDMRQIRVRLTQQGRELHHIVVEIVKETEQNVLSGVTPEEQELLDPYEAFCAFFSEMNGREMTEQEDALMRQVIAEELEGGMA